MSVTENGGCQSANHKTVTAAKRYADPQSLIIECFEMKYSGDRRKYSLATVGNLIAQKTFVFVPGVNSRSDVYAWERALEEATRRSVSTQCCRYSLNGVNYWSSQSMFSHGNDLHTCEYCAPSTCLWCGSLFFNHGSRVWDSRRDREETYREIYTAWKSYCSAGCRIALNREKESSRRRENRKASRMTGFKLCEKCGVTFLPKRNTAKFCSTRCRVAANRAIGKGGAS
jgi:hypothetical protein